MGPKPKHKRRTGKPHELSSRRTLLPHRARFLLSSSPRLDTIRPCALERLGLRMWEASTTIALPNVGRNTKKQKKLSRLASSASLARALSHTRRIYRQPCLSSACHRLLSLLRGVVLLLGLQEEKHTKFLPSSPSRNLSISLQPNHPDSLTSRATIATFRRAGEVKKRRK